MARTAFPIETSLGTVFGLDPRVARERLLTLWSDIRGTSILRNFVYSGMTLSAGAGLSVNVATGNAVVEGYLLELNTASENKSGLTDGTTNYIWAQITRDGNNVLTGWALVANTGASVANAVLLGIAVTAGGVVTSVTNSPPSRHSPLVGNYSGNGATSDRTIFLGAEPRFVVISAEDGAIYSESGAATGATQYGLAITFDGATTAPAIVNTTTQRPELVTYGFLVKHTGSATPSINKSGVTYRYVAWL